MLEFISYIIADIVAVLGYMDACFAAHTIILSLHSFTYAG
jgi:hypothetical protein